MKSLIILIILATAVTAVSERACEVSHACDITTGELEVLIKDAPSGDSEIEYYLRTPGKLVQLKGTLPPGLVSGDEVAVYGAMGEDSITTEEVTVLAEAITVEERNVVVILVNLLNVSAAPKQEVIDLMYGQDSVQEYYWEASHGQHTWINDTDGDGSPDVFGPYTINYTGAVCDQYAWATAAEAAATTAGVNLSQYRHRLFVLPHVSQHACTWSGWANIGCGSFCRAWTALDTISLYSHELGHNLGMHHASTDPENDGIVNSEYGDHSCIMGASYSDDTVFSFNAPHHDQLGWPDAFGSELTVTESGIHSVYALGYEPTPIQSLKIEKGDTNDFYYVSYRPPVGVDALISTTYTGTSVHFHGGGATRTMLIDVLANGEKFVDTVNGINITQLGMNSTHVTVQVDIRPPEPCEHIAPLVSFFVPQPVLAAGTNFSALAQVTNNDASTCNSTTFTLQSAAVLTPTAITINAGQIRSALVQVDTTNYAEGTYPVSVTAQSAVHAPVTGNTSFIVDANPPTAPPNFVAEKKKKDEAHLSWDASTDSASGVVSYNVFRSSEGNSVLLINLNGTSYNEVDLPDGDYSYWVTALDFVGYESAPSANITVVIGNGGGQSTDCDDRQDNDGDGFCDYNGCTLGKGKNRYDADPDPECNGNPAGSEN